MQRSGEDLTPGQQVYAVIEFCRDPETLWNKIRSGHWDWLGVRAEKGGRPPTFILGRPRAGRLSGEVSVTVTRAGGSGAHRVVLSVPHIETVDNIEHRTAEDARAEFDRLVHDLSEGGKGSGLYRVRLFIDHELADQKFVVRARPNVL